MPPKAAKKKKGISLTPEKKKLLKQLIMQKAAEELKKQQAQEVEEKKQTIESRLPKLAIDGLSKDALEKRVKDLYQLVAKCEEEKYDWEVRLDRELEEINELNMKVNDVKGKFSRPMLKRVSKEKATFDKDAISKNKLTLTTLKSTGQPKFAVEEKEEEKKPDWGSEQLKRKESESGEPEQEAAAEPAAEEEEEEEE